VTAILSSDAETPASFLNAKWERDALVASRRARNNRDFGTADPEHPRKKPDYGIVRRAIRRRFRDLDLKFLSPVSSGAPLPDAGSCRTRRHVNGELVPQSR
jgi:hypothetical protein